MLAATLCPKAVHLQPELAALAILDAALLASHAALLAALVHRGRPPQLV